MSTNLVKQMVFSAAAIALAMVISTVVKLPSLPNGGSVTLFSMLMITLIGYWYGLRAGLCTAIAYGILQYMVGPYFVHPIQVLLDYPLAFGALGLSGLFTNKKHGLVVGYIVGVTGRYAMHMISGLIFYTAYVGDLSENMAAVGAAFAYNATYIVPEAVLTIVLISLPPVKNALDRVKKMK